MFNWKEFERFKNIFSYTGFGYQDRLAQHHVSLRPKDLVRWMEFTKDDLDFLTLVDIVAVELTNERFQFEIIYHLLNMGSHQRLNLHVLCDDHEVIPSVSSFFHHAEWMEREQAEMLGLTFGKEMEPLILPVGQTFYPLRKKAKIPTWPKEAEIEIPKIRVNPNKSEAPYIEESYEWKRFNILSSESMGNFEWLVCFDPLRTVDSKVKVGFHHQGWEKILETKPWNQALQLVDSLNPGSAPTYSIAWIRTLEELMRVKVPERAQAIRIVMLELARIGDHLTVMAQMVRALEKDEFRLFVNAREKVYELFEKYCGHRQGFGIPQLGGVRENLPHGWVIEFQDVSEVVSKTLRMVTSSLIGQNDFRENLSSSPVNAQTALDCGVSGPAMRACGLNFDLRKSQPFYFYQDIDFDIPVGVHGTAYDRFLIRYEEIFQSLHIITQVIDNLPLGEVVSEAALETFKNHGQKFEWHYSCLESPNGEAGFFLTASDGEHPYRVKIKTPSFALTQALPQFMIGLKGFELRAALASMGIRAQEIDR